MKNVTVYPGNANGIVSAPPSKQEALPAIILAAITRTSARGVGSSTDTISLFNGLFSMGAKFRQQDDVVTFYTAPKRSEAAIECTHDVLMLLLPLCIVLGGEYTFLGEFDNRTIAGLESLDIDWSVSEQGISIRSDYKTRDIVLEDDTFATGFMLALAVSDGAKLTLRDHNGSTELIQAIMQKFGFSLSDQDGYAIAGQREADTSYIYSIGGDFGMSAYLLLAGFLSGEVGVTGLLADSMQSGRSVIEQLKNMKLNVVEMNGAVFARKSRMSDEVIDASVVAEPIVFLVLACFGKSKCVIKNVNHLAAAGREAFNIVLESMHNIGADIVKIGAEYFVTGKKKLFGGNVNAHGSVSAALALAAAGLVSEIGVTIGNAPSINLLSGLGVIVQ